MATEHSGLQGLVPLSQLRRRIEHWRRTRTKRSPMPADLWMAATELVRMVRRLSADWQQLYGHPVYFVETFVDPERFRGTCYRAANWMPLGTTTGRGKDDLTHRPNRSRKDVLGYPLIPQFRERLSAVG